MTAQGYRETVGFLVPVDGIPSSKNTLIRWDELTRNADLIAAKHVLFIMDACYSGLAIQRTAVAPGTERFLRDMLQRYARQVITAGKADETVADGGGPSGKNSIFTGYLLEGLGGKAADEHGVLTANELMHYVYQKVSQDNRSHQTPHYGHLDGDGDFVLRSPEREHLAPTTTADYLVPAIEEMPEAVPAAEATKSSFLIRSGYHNADHPSFGRNDWSKKLAERHHGDGVMREVLPATSWLAIIAEPVTSLKLSIDLDSQVKQLPNKIYASEKPYEQFQMPSTAITTVDSLVLYDMEFESKRWIRYLRIEEAGNLEYAESWHPFYQFGGTRYFRYVQLIGITWQFLFLMKNLLNLASYTGGVKFTLNLVGTRETVLNDFAQIPGEGGHKWIEPSAEDASFRGVDPRVLTCHARNLQVSYQVVLAKLDEGESFKIIKDVRVNAWTCIQSPIIAEVFQRWHRNLPLATT